MSGLRDYLAGECDGPGGTKTGRRGGWKPKPCKGCGGPKPKGRGVLYCDSCDRKPTWNFGKQPCRACGSTENKEYKRQYCNECLEFRQWRNERKRANRKVVERHPCERCGGRKPEGKGRKLCDTCKAATANQPVVCRYCRERPVRGPGLRACQPCKDAGDARRAERSRQAARRRYARDPEGERRRARERRQRRAADPVTRKRDLEMRRIQYRVRAQRKGREVRHLRVVPDDEKVRVPSRPLAAVIERLAQRSDLVLVCELAGVQERQVARWRSGELTDVSVDVADRALLGLDLFWWDVWNEDTVRVPAFVVTTYARQKKKAKNGKRRYLRIKQRTVPYGDLGVDRAALDEIGRVFSGDLADQAAA